MQPEKYSLVFDPDVSSQIDAMPPERRSAVLKAADVLAQNPFTEFSVPFGDDDTVRAVDLTPWVRIRYIVRNHQVYVFVYHLTDFRAPLFGSED